jgi:hypothetical protein
MIVEICSLAKKSGEACCTEEVVQNLPFGRDFKGAGGGTRTHTPRREPDFESDKDCGMVRDAALRSAFIGLFPPICGMLRVGVRPDCHQSSHQNHL